MENTGHFLSRNKAPVIECQFISSVWSQFHIGPRYLANIPNFGLPKPISSFFLACICFYVLTISLGNYSIIGNLAANGYSFVILNPILVEVVEEITYVSKDSFGP